MRCDRRKTNKNREEGAVRNPQTGLKSCRETNPENEPDQGAREMNAQLHSLTLQALEPPLFRKGSNDEDKAEGTGDRRGTDAASTCTTSEEGKSSRLFANQPNLWNQWNGNEQQDSSKRMPISRYIVGTCREVPIPTFQPTVTNRSQEVGKI